MIDIKLQKILDKVPTKPLADKISKTFGVDVSEIELMVARERPKLFPIEVPKEKFGVFGAIVERVEIISFSTAYDAFNQILTLGISLAYSHPDGGGNCSHAFSAKYKSKDKVWEFVDVGKCSFDDLEVVKAG